VILQVLLLLLLEKAETGGGEARRHPMGKTFYYAISLSP